MKILQLHAGYRTPAGEDTVVHAEAAVLRQAGHEVEQLIEHNPHGTTDALLALGRSRYNRSTGAAVLAACARFEPDIVHVHNTWFALSSSVIDAAADARVPIVMTVHNYRLGCLGADLFRNNATCTACVGRSPLSGVIHGCYRNSRALSAIAALEIVSTRRRGSLDRIDRFVAPSAFAADRLVDIGVPADRLTVKPHFTADPGSRSRSPSEADDLLFIGRVAAAKGIRTLLRGWERYTSRSRDHERRLTIIGDGPLLPEAREAASHGVEFAGWLGHDEVRDRMLNARAFVFPSEWYEPFGMVLIEAMAAGLPVVATTASDAARITGTPPQLVASAGDEAALADCLDQLDDDTVDTVGTAARERFLETFSEAAGTDALEALYEDVLGSDRLATR